jgi:hypothetical protein
MLSRRARSIGVFVSLGAVGCAPGIDEVDQQTSEVAVSTLRGRAGCSTAGAEGLSAQLLDELLCLSAGRLVPYAPDANITLTNPRVHPVLAPAARDAILRAAARVPLRINSGFRTLVEQWLLWTAAGCGLVATPGSSNHETGRAVDVDNWSAARSALQANGFVQSYPTNDPVHFDGPGDDFRALSVRAFQRLWNANNPTDRIAEDGAWGPMTQARLERSPAEGFRVGRVCGMTAPTDPRLRAQFVSQSFLPAATPIEMTPGQELAGFIEMRNTGTEPWVPGRTFLATTQPRDRASAVAHPSWTANNRPATVDRMVAMGATGRFAFTIRAPMTAGDYPEYFGMLHSGVGWFSDPTQGGPPDNQLQIRVRVGRAAFGATVVRNTCETAVTLAPGDARSCTIELRNTGGQPWAMGATSLATAEPRDHESALADLSWSSPARVASVARTVAAGESYAFTFELRAPAEGGAYVEHFNLVDATGGWFSDMANAGPSDAEIVVRVNVPGGDGGASDGGIEPPIEPIDGGVPRQDASARRDGSGPIPGEPLSGGCGCAVPARETSGRGGRPLAALALTLVSLATLSVRSARRATRPGR